MIHDEMVLVVPVLAFTFVVMAWIVAQFRGYLKQRDEMVAEMEARHAPVEIHHRESFRDAA